MVPITGRASSVLEKNVFLKTNIKLTTFLYALLSSSVSRANLSCVVSTFFSSLAFLSSSVSMANLSSLVGPSFSSFAVLSSSLSTANQSCLLATSFSSLRFLSNSFSSPHFNLLEWLGAVSRGLLFLTTFSFPLVVLWFSFLLYLFRVLSSAFLSSVLQSLCLL